MDKVSWDFQVAELTFVPTVVALSLIGNNGMIMIVTSFKFWRTLTAILGLSASVSFAQGLIVNEFSNGPSGTKEYFELVVVGPPGSQNCGPIDLRGWILDDNNGDFSCGACASTGIASGHVRFANHSNWATVPTGSIIVIYDGGDRNISIPPDDPDDTSPPDGVYILPSSSTLLEVSTGAACAPGNIPFASGSCGTCAGNSAYLGACYTPGGLWSPVGLRNTGDAAQVRDASGVYFHGIGYGTVASGISGGPDALFFAGDGTGRYYYFDNTSTDDHRSMFNYATALVGTGIGETPGLPNSANNAAWISSLTVPCPLPVVWSSELAGTPLVVGNLLQWATALEINADRFELERASHPSQPFETIAVLKARGHPHASVNYDHLDRGVFVAKAYYRLRQIDGDGVATFSRTVEVINHDLPGMVFDFWPNPSNGIIKYRAVGGQGVVIRVTDPLGRVHAEFPLQAKQILEEGSLDLSELPAGTYMLQLTCSQGLLSRKLVIQAR